MKWYEAIGNMYAWETWESKVFIFGLGLGVVPWGAFWKPLAVIQACGVAMWATALTVSIVKNVKKRRYRR